MKHTKNTDPGVFNFYVLMGDAASQTVRKVPLVQDMQRDLTVHFEVLRSEFKTADTQFYEYDPGYRPQPGELFEVTPFEMSADLKALSPSPPLLATITDDELESGNLRAVVGVSQANSLSETVFVFQALDARQVIRREGFTFFASGNLFRKNDRAGITVRDRIDAVVEDGNLYFASEFVVRRFLDLTALFEEATDADVAAFLGEKLFSVADTAVVVRLADQWVRRKIKLVESRGILAKVKAKQVQEAASTFGLEFKVKANRIVMPTDKKGLKDLLRFLDEDYLESNLTETQFMVNSKRKL